MSPHTTHVASCTTHVVSYTTQGPDTPSHTQHKDLTCSFSYNTRRLSYNTRRLIHNTRIRHVDSHSINHTTHTENNTRSRHVASYTTQPDHGTHNAHRTWTTQHRQNVDHSTQTQHTDRKWLTQRPGQARPTQGRGTLPAAQAGRGSHNAIHRAGHVIRRLMLPVWRAMWRPCELYDPLPSSVLDASGQ